MDVFKMRIIVYFAVNAKPGARQKKKQRVFI